MFSILLVTILLGRGTGHFRLPSQDIQSNDFHMPKTAVKFGQELQATLQPMIIKPSAGGVQVSFSSTVSVLYVIVFIAPTGNCCMLVYRCSTSNSRLCETGKPPEVLQWLVHFFGLGSHLVNLSARLQQAINRPASQANDSRTLIALVNIVSLLAENCNFDALRKDHSSEYTAFDDCADIDSLCRPCS
jgi:cohesin loading factor subunit SCC2